MQSIHTDGRSGSAALDCHEKCHQNSFKGKLGNHVTELKDRITEIGKAAFHGATLGTAGAPIGLVTTLIAYNTGVLEAVARRTVQLLQRYSQLEDLATRLSIVKAHRFVIERMYDAIDWILPQSIFGFNRFDTGMAVLGTPLLDEIEFRGVIQDVLLTRVPKFVIRKIAPGYESSLDSRIYKAAKIIFTASLFALRQMNHFPESGPFITSGLLVYGFTAGIALGVMKESKPGLIGCVTAYASHNLVKHSLIFLFQSADMSLKI